MDEELEVEEQEDVRIIFLGEKENVLNFSDAAFEKKNRKKGKIWLWYYDSWYQKKK